MPDRVRPRRRWVALALLAVGLALAARVSHGAGDRFFYRPDGFLRTTLPPGASQLRFESGDGTELDGWWLPAVGEARGTVVYCHGNHANLTHHLRFASWLPQHGFQVLIFDYRGYGRSAGVPTREGTVLDAVAAIDVALRRDPERTVVFGHSLGGAVGLVAAARRPAVRALVVESSFPSYRAAARAAAPPLGFLVPWLVSDGLDPIDALADLPPRPLLVVHGTEDRITPFALGRQLFEAAREPKRMRVVEGGGHLTPWVREGRAFEDEIVAFLVDAIGR